jgi:hypothetical protein
MEHQIQQKPLKGIASAGNDNAFYPLLYNWLFLTEKYADAWEYRDVPWIYGERTATGLLAAAAWQAEGIALEEARAEKGGAPKKGKLGLCDLYFRLGKVDYVCETKRMWLKIKSPEKDSGLNKGMAQIQKSLDGEAVRVLKKLKGGGAEVPLGVLFVAFDFGLSKPSEENIPSVLNIWNDHLKQTQEGYTAAAWFFPLHKMSVLKDKQRSYPGGMVFVKRAG